MRVGVISEGPADFAVLRNILKAALGLDAADVDSIRPELQTDETSLHTPGEKSFSNWEIVKQECIDGSSIAAYLESNLDEVRIVVVQIDTAECHHANFGVARPDKTSATYVVDCCQAVAVAIVQWTAGNNANHLVKAVAVEETDAWLIPLYDASSKAKKRDSGTINNPKEYLFKCLQNTKHLTNKERARILREKRELARYAALSAPLRKRKTLLEVMKQNESLRIFVEELCQVTERLVPEMDHLLKEAPREEEE